MLLLSHHNGTLVAGRRDRLALGSIQATPSLTVSIAAGQTLAFDPTGDSVEMRVREGTIWFTEAGQDRFAAAGAIVLCPRHGRMVITALADARLQLRTKPQPPAQTGTDR